MGYHIPLIDLGKSKKVTAVLKLKTQFSPKGLNQIEVKKFELCLVYTVKTALI